MAVTSPEQYRDRLLALAPRGAAWPHNPDSWFGRLMLGLADSFFRVDAAVEQLTIEGDPRSADMMLPDWENEAGLSSSAQATPLDIAQRRFNLVSKLTSRGGQSIAYFTSLATSLGFAITITEFKEWTVNDAVDEPLNGADWNYVWQVNAAATTSIEWTVASDVEEPFVVDLLTQMLESAIRDDKPAHTVVLFNYQ